MKNSDLKEKYFKKCIDDFETFSEKITCARVNFYKGKKRGILTQLQAAKKIGITSSYLCELESGKKPIPDSYIILKKFEEVYGFQTDELLLMVKNKLIKAV
ncbi:MAG: helix-turn-helix transcriptional regulator [Bacillota bacterium]|nr:helix-turn-helix transcriptional regulator [Bacillota bacterium]